MATQFNSFTQLVRHLSNRALPLYKAHIRQVLNEVGREVRDEVRAMAGESMPGVGPYPPWAPLKQSTIDRKTQRNLGKGGNPASPLWASGRFASDINYHIEATRWIAVVGTNAKYMENHEFGFVHHVSGKSVPPRPIFGPAAEMVLPRYRNRIKLAALTGLSGVAYGRF